MYVQITTKCNMKCQHCCYSCRPGFGSHMTKEIFLQALNVLSDYGSEYVSLGGGEPTLHPNFLEFLKISLRQDFSVWLATNGSQKKTMVRLAQILDENDFDEDDPIILDSPDKLAVALSTDYYHDRSKVSDWVYDYWTKRSERHGFYGHSSRGFETRNVNRVIKAGRAKRTGHYTDEKGCVCSDCVIKPDGTIMGCGCDKAPKFGTVYKPEIPEGWRLGECSFSDENIRLTKAIKTH